MNDLIGKLISHYRIIKQVGQGGMGVVYKAHDTNLDRDVALKFLPSQFTSTDEEKARFIQEAKAASSMSHPNVCTIHDIQEYEGSNGNKQLFIVMEYVEGKTLKDKKDSLSEKQMIEIGMQVAEGLAAAHEKGIVHRDIKPENIMIRKDGIAQIMDFGLAKLYTSANGSRITKLGTTMGTLSYMSPEQVQGLDTDHRSDIFSLGVLLYELFTGQLPFRGVHETALAYDIVNVDAPPMSSVKPEIDPNLDTIVLECLAKEPDERTQSAKQVSVDLKRYRRELSRQQASRFTAARPEVKLAQSSGAIERSERSRKPVFWYALLGLLSLAVILLIFNPWQKEVGTSQPALRFTVDVPNNAPLYGLESGLSISPDGKYIAYLAQVQNTSQLYLHRMDQMNSTPIPGTENAIDQTFSPDGQWVVFNSSVQHKLVKLPILGGPPEVLCPMQSATRGISWASDNSILFGLVNGGIYRVAANGRTPEVVTSLDSAAGEISHRFPQLLPDGETIMFTIKQNNITAFDEAVIVAQRIGTRERKILVRGGSFAKYIPTGYLIYTRAKTIFAVPFDAERLEVKGSPVPIEEGVYMNSASGQAWIDFSNNGILIFAPVSAVSSVENLMFSWMDRHGTTSPLYDTLRVYDRARLSPDGQKIVTDIGAANDDIWVCQVVRGVLTRLTFGGGNNNFPIWSPDGKYVVYNSEKGNSPNIFRKPWNGSGAEERLTNNSNAQIPVSFTPDGKNLSFDQNGDIWILPLDSSSGKSERKPWPFVQSPFEETEGLFSSDGRWMAYTSNESGKNEVYVVAFPKREGKWQISSGGGVTPIWSRNGKELFYLNGSSLMVVNVLAANTFDFSVPRKVCEIPSNVTLWDISPDGQRFLAIVTKAQQLTFPRLEGVTEWFEAVKVKCAGNKN